MSGPSDPELLQGGHTIADPVLGAQIPSKLGYAKRKKCIVLYTSVKIRPLPALERHTVCSLNGKGFILAQNLSV